jgi:acetate kinase
VASVLVVNAGSTSLKLHMVDEGERVEPKATIDEVDADLVVAVGHRVVHGGLRFREPVVIDSDVRRAILDLERLAPLHNSPAVSGIEAASVALPRVPHVAVFDTAFHATIPQEAAVYALPRRWREDWGIRRYGFHGLSIAWSSERAPVMVNKPTDSLRLVICHLGGGSSVTAIRGGRSVDTTMGFSPLEGVPMTTRSGSVDPGALIHLIRERGLDPGALDHDLNLESGLKGLAGGSGSMLDLEQASQAGDANATLAIDVFVHRVAGAAASMAAAAGGIDALIFTAGIGEGSALIREEVCSRLEFLGVEVDRERNASAEPDCDIAVDRSAVRVLVVRAREELVVARAVRYLVSPDRNS